jgi:hypothetical protein
LNKFLIIIFFLCGVLASAKDSLAAANKVKIVYTEKNIVVDSAFIQLKPFAKNFKSRYSDSSFIYEFKTPEKNSWDRFKEWLVHFLQKLFSFTDSKTAANSIEIFLKVLAILIVVLVIYMIVKAIMNKEGQWIFGRNSDRKIINYDEIERNLHLVDFEKLIQKSIESKENRFTIRYYYLWMLKKMSEAQIIVWDVEKTNTDYLYEIKDETQKEDFAYLSYLYNNIWYGEFEMDETTFIKAKTAFEKSINKINNG